MDRFHTEFDAINGAIAAFNKFMAAEFNIPQFNLDTAIQDKSIIEILHGDWNGFPFPNNGTRGVYFLFGHSKGMPGKNAIYIGKASLGSTTSNRLYTHLSPFRQKDFYEMNSCQGEAFILDYMASIDLDKLGIPFISPALEEYLITTLRDRFTLMNGTGN